MVTSQYTPPTDDPRAALRQKLVDSDISPEIAALRLAVLRLDVPQALVQIDSVRADDTAIAVKVTIGFPGGARHSGITAIDVDPDTSWAEQHDMTQAIAIARVLDGLGREGDREQQTRQPSARAEPRPEPSRQVKESPISPATAERPESDHLPEYSWTSFWQAAHGRNITREQVEQALGRSVQQATPKDAVEALESAGLWG